MTDGQLLSCPNCFKLGKQQILGRMLPTGDFLVLRFHHGTTLLRGSSYSIACGCGFAYSIAGTVVEQIIM